MLKEEKEETLCNNYCPETYVDEKCGYLLAKIAPNSAEASEDHKLTEPLYYD